MPSTIVPPPGIASAPAALPLIDPDRLPTTPSPADAARDCRRDVSLLRNALDAACGDLIHEHDLDEATAAVVCRWLPPHGPADAPYWLAGDVEALLDGAPDR